MKKIEFDPGKVLGSGILRLSRRELCELAVKLCAQIRAEAGTRAYRGGVYPDNISVDSSGGVSIGLARQSGWVGQELQFLPPELYWNGKRGSYSDVYALGMLLYYAVSKGRLPFDGESPDPQKRRMDGENFKAPKAAGARLGEIIEKATRFDPQERYANVEELQIMLESLITNLYLNGAPSAEAIFKKSDDELTDLERLMVGIIENGETEPVPEEAEEEQPVLILSEEGTATAGEDEAEEVRVYEPHHRSRGGFTASGPAGAPNARPIIPVLTEEKNPELAPVTPKGPITPAVQYGKSAAREKKIAEEVKKRRRRPAVVILALCAVLIVVAILANAWLKDFAWGDDEPAAQETPGTVSASDPYASGFQADITPDEGEEEPEAPVVETVSRYEIFREDVSWTQARDRCEALGGHLAVITDEEEYNQIVALARERGIPNLWIGLHRENGENVWVTGEEVGFYPWDAAAGEPSYVDTYDDVAEDYVMLWNHNGGWYYNDSRNDPVGDYPQWYSGVIGFVCEYETPVE